MVQPAACLFLCHDCPRSVRLNGGDVERKTVGRETVGREALVEGLVVHAVSVCYPLRQNAAWQAGTEATPIGTLFTLVSYGPLLHENSTCTYSSLLGFIRYEFLPPRGLVRNCGDGLSGRQNDGSAMRER